MFYFRLNNINKNKNKQTVSSFVPQTWGLYEGFGVIHSIITA